METTEEMQIVEEIVMAFSSNLNTDKTLWQTVNWKKNKAAPYSRKGNLVVEYLRLPQIADQSERE